VERRSSNQSHVWEGSSAWQKGRVRAGGEAESVPGAGSALRHAKVPVQEKCKVEVCYKNFSAIYLVLSPVGVA